MNNGEAGTTYGYENRCITTIITVDDGRRPSIPNTKTQKLLQYNHIQPRT